MPLITALCALLLFFCTAVAHAQWDEPRVDLYWADPALRWRTLRTEHFEVHFAEQHRAQARLVAGIAERVYVRTTRLLDWEPRRRTQLVVFDSGDFSNGFASPVPYNFSGIFLAPPDQGELLQSREWLELVISHELFHIVHMDKASGTPVNARDVLGRLLPFFPNALQPAWVIEGLAVLDESDPRLRYGRLGNTYFEGMMRAEVARGLRSLREVNAGGRGFPLNRDYLYGSYFFLFLRERYGERAVRLFIDTYSGNIVPFKIDSDAMAVTGKGMEPLWAEYQDWLRARFAPDRGESVQGRELARHFSLSSPLITPKGTRWYVQADGYTRPRLMQQSAEGRPRQVREVERDTRLSNAQGEAVFVSQLDICGNHNLLYELSEAAPDGKRRQITRCGRDRLAAALAEGRIVTVRAIEGTTEVSLLQPDGSRRTLYRSEPSESVTGVAARDTRVVITRLRASQWALVDVSDGSPRVLLEDEAVKHSPRFGESGDEIFFIADYDRTYDIWSWRTGRASVSRWTRSPYGIREMSAAVGGEILLTTLEADGVALRLHRLPAAPLEQRATAGTAEARPDPVAAVPGEERAYSALSTLRPTAWLPLLQIADGAVAIGALVLGQDALELHRYLLAPMVELTQGTLLGRAEYLYDGRHGLLANRTLTVRASEPDGSSTKIQAYSIQEDAQWVSLWRSLRLDRRLYWGLGAAIAREDFRDVSLGSLLTQDERVVGLLAGYDSRRQQWLSEGPSQGQELRLFAETSHRLGGAYSGNVYRADWRGHLPLGRSVAALRWNEAYGQETAEVFELGGSKSDEVILLPVLNERDFALRGYTTGTPELMGHRARIVTLEWRTPLSDIDRHLVVPPLGINRVALNLFFDAGAAWEKGSSPDYHRGIGAELMSEPRLGYLFGLQARIGFARGLDPGGSTKIYLRAGRSF
jgi:hypothetical protein